MEEPVVDVKSVIQDLRRAIQDYGSEHSQLGPVADAAAASWQVSKYGFSLPDEYFEFVATHDGAVLLDPVYFSMAESLRFLAIYRHDWAEPPRFWPVSTDGCGNYYCLDVRDSSESPGQVVFIDTMEAPAEPSRVVAASFIEFVGVQVDNQVEHIKRREK